MSPRQSGNEEKWTRFGRSIWPMHDRPTDSYPNARRWQLTRLDWQGLSNTLRVKCNIARRFPITMTITNRQIRLAARPVGMPKDSDWNLTTEPVRAIVDGEVLVKIIYVSLDPAMRGWMNDSKSYMVPVGVGEVMRAGVLGTVVASKNAGFAIGDHVIGMLGVQQYAVSDGTGLTRFDSRRAPLPVYLGALGMPGMTAYFGLLEIGRPQPGETVVVSGAAGAVGSVVGQIARIKGCRVVGIAGGPTKCDYVSKGLRFDAVIDYKAENVKAALAQACPNGIDVYFDNVGGEILDAALERLALGARVIICGAVSQYNNTGPTEGPSNYLSLLVNRASMTGMLVFDYHARYGEAVREIAGWMAAGQLISTEDIVVGIEKFPQALLMLFKGENMGKLILRVNDV